MNPAYMSSSPIGRGKKALQGFDPYLLLSAVLLICVGLALIFSEGFGKEGLVFFRKQLTSLAIGIVPFAIFAFVQPRFWMRISTPLYIINILMLAADLVIGKTINGAKRWIMLGPLQFQPADTAKILLILTLASFFTRHQDRINEFSTFALSGLHILVPLLLILKQPSLGSSMGIVAVWLSVCLVSQVPMKYVFGSGAALVVLFLASIQFGVLKPYQLERIEGLINGNAKGNGYHALRAKIAFGTGGLVGQGYLRGEQKKGGYIPEQQTDYIFTVMGEEGGLMGCSLVLALFGFFFYRVWLVMMGAAEPLYRMIAAGILGMLAFHTLVNLGMIMGLLPVVGQWLPFMSYGGTAMWLCMACVAMLLNIRAKESPTMY